MELTHAPGTSAGNDDLLRSGTYRKAMWRLLPFLFICYMWSYLDKINVAFAKLEMLSDLKLSETVYGFGAAAFFAGYLLFEIPSNLLLLHIGPRRWIGRIMMTWGIISACMMFVKSPTSFYVLRFFLGVAEAGFFPAVLLYLTYWFPSARRGKVTAIFLTGIPMSGFIGGPLSGWIMNHFDGAHGIAGWQWLFLLEGLPTVVLGVIAWFRLDDRVADAKWLSADEKNVIEGDLRAEPSGQALHSIAEGLLNPRILLLSFIYFLLEMGLFGVIFWLPSLIKSLGVSNPLHIGLLSAIPYATAVAAMLLTSVSSDRTGDRRWHLGVPGLISAVALIVSVVYVKEPAVALLALTVSTMGVMTTISQFWLLPPSFLRGPAAAAGIALANSVGSVAGVVSPAVLGVLQSHTGASSIGLVVLSVSLIAGSLLVFLIPAKLVNVRRS